MMTFLGRNELLNAFELLDDELGRMGVEADLFVVGGAAMAVAYDARRATTDVDAVFVPSKEVRTAASRVAEELGLEEDWLNDGVKGFLPGEDVEQVDVYEGKSLHVAAASPKFLLAMKLMALRTERDVDDIRTLYEICGLTTAEEGLAVLESFYPQHLVLPRVQFLLQEMFPEPPHLSKDNGMSL
ncbi:MAG TPA: DUF6036 family nucleotidyltransferase [Acidimicrobiales bacterium]